MWPSLLLRALPYILAASLGAFSMRYWDSLRIAKVKTEYSQYQAQVAQANAASEKAANDALMKQASEHLKVQTYNEEVIHELEKKALDARAQHDSDSAFIRRLLNQSPKAASGSGSVSEASSQPGTSGPSGESSAQALAVNLCVDTKAEDERNADRLDALIAQIKPQL